MTTAPRYIGRFAPTPSGPLHFGSLVTALASWLDARRAQGRWLLRIDDVDAPRVDPAAEEAIVRALDAHQLYWDGAIVRQSDHEERYRAALRRLQPLCFACRCSRRVLGGARIYPGTCRHLGLAKSATTSIRVRVDDGRIEFEDRVQGRHTQQLADESGDFVVWRRDDMAAYPLAVVVDDDAMGVTHVLRGADLLPNTPRQLYIADALETRRPSYAHLPVIVETGGIKLSKHTGATALDNRFARHNLTNALNLLGFEPPPGDIPELLTWAVANWNIRRVPAVAAFTGFIALTS
ncbi:MAG: tRNA glutamyl-Q(34) synthetase GluQRS [Gammaproteobacteria bacterium]|nr:tRNA glutamyl-Q(34) synthetase GluQRS [Gammaproteobacteria bacterium]